MIGALALLGGAALAALDGPADGLGVGVVGGEPNGLSIAWRRDDSSALQLASGWSLPTGMLKVNTDYVVAMTELPSGSQRVVVTTYVGGGARLRIAGDAPVRENNQSGVGMRVPIGLRAVPEGKRVDLFIEVAPSMMLYPRTSGGLDFGLGARIWTGR